MEQAPQKISVIKQLKDLEYPIVLGIFVLVIVGLFIGAARFLSVSINAAISSPDETQIQAQLTYINTADYDPIREKLHLPEIGSTAQEFAPPAESTSTPETTTPPTPTTQEPRSEEVKSTFSLAVFNSTNVAGTANTVRNELVAAGFTVAKPGNKTPTEPQTVVQIKERVQASPAILEEILSVLGKRFAIGDPQILESSSPYDVVIIIGTR